MFAASLPGKEGQGCGRRAGLTSQLGSASWASGAILSHHLQQPTQLGNPVHAGAQTRGFSPGSWHCPQPLQSFLCTVAWAVILGLSSVPTLPLLTPLPGLPLSPG